MRHLLRTQFLVIATVVGVAWTPMLSIAADSQPLTMIVMDPLAAPLSCPCVKGYAQRKYEELGKYLEQELGRPVRIEFSESLGKALDKTDRHADLVIGKRSVVAAQSKQHKVPLSAVLALSGKDGQTTQTGLVVVPASDPARTVADLKGYRIIFGPADCDEKHNAAIALLKKHGVTAAEKIETCAACSDGATTILEAGPDSRAATVISSYAAPLLEGCGTIEKGDLRVIGTTEPVPFIAAFISTALPESDQAAITAALKEVGEEPVLLGAIESKSGFVPEDNAVVAETSPAAKKKN
ncbi:MAG: PhnD/SsuA/transferrin family substrate-binding protein [Planctomycetaceae bacterium]